MAIINTGLLTKGLRSEFFDRFEGTTTHFQDLATRIQSNSDSETYKWLGSLPTMREWGTGRKAQGIFEESYDVKNNKYELTIEVDRDEIADDQTGQIRLRIGELATRAAFHKDSLIGSLLKSGETAGFNSYDGVTFFNAAHLSGDSDTQDNTLAPAAAVANTPTTAEFRTAIGDAIARMLAFVDDQGEPMNLSADGLVAVVPPSMLVTALESLNTTLVNSTSNVLQGAARVIAFPHLTAATTFYLLKTEGVGVRPFVFQDREPIEFNELEAKSETGFMREVYMYGVRARYNMTYGYWQHAIKATFA